MAAAFFVESAPAAVNWFAKRLANPLDEA